MAEKEMAERAACSQAAGFRFVKVEDNFEKVGLFARL